MTVELEKPSVFQQARETLSALPQQECPVEHIHTKGLYTRKIFMPAGTMVVSKIHKTQHPFVILKGAVSVHAKNDKVRKLSAGYIGVTEPGTERMLLIHEDTVWVTFHPNPTDEQDLAKLEDFIIQPLPSGLCPGSPPLLP